MESPDNESNYVKVECQGIDVFLDKKIKSEKNLITIKLSGFSIFKTIEVSGAYINSWRK
ncbi:hypothetical protein [Wukongibacter baidiensis]|uniref:hypothetical protein n=1 Tax=Wukongibacter baidiensis TaxID=1723361 RepID=UPI003D7F4CC3